jgi:hypothetical protein
MPRLRKTLEQYMSARSNNPLAWATSTGWSIIPTGRDKKPAIPTWKPFQARKPTREEITEWSKMNPSAWAVVTGAVSGIVTLDFDGDAGRDTLGKLAIKPHRKTPSGGFHADFKHPGWRVPTLNSKSKRALSARWPGLDIRGDGGYAIFYGRTEKGRYRWLTEDGPYELEILLADLREFLELDKAPTPKEEHSPHTGASKRRVRPDPVNLLNRALAQFRRDGRNNTGAWLAAQLRDNGYNSATAESYMLEFARRVPARNLKGQLQPYTDAEARATLKSIYSRPAREPWANSRVQPISTMRPTSAGDEKPGIRRERWQFALNKQGVFRIDPESTHKDRWISPPLYVDARARDFNGEGCGKLLRFCNEDGQEKTCIIPHSALIGDGKQPLERLLDMGFKPSREKKDLEALKDYIYQSKPDATVRCVFSAGWHNGFFFATQKLRPGGLIRGRSLFF